MRIGEVLHLVRALQLARGEHASGRHLDQEWGGVTFRIGAGCSRSAGIPLAVEIAQEQAIVLARTFTNETFASNDPEDAKAWLHENLPDDFPPSLSWSGLRLGLTSLGELERGLPLLVDAIRNLEAALVVRTRDGMPVHWAVTQRNYGAALQARAELDPSVENFRTAIGAFHAAQEIAGAFSPANRQDIAERLARCEERLAALSVSPAPT